MEVVEDDQTKRNNQCRAGNPIYPSIGTKREELRTGMSIGRHELVLSYDSTAKAPHEDGSKVPALRFAPPGFGELWLSSLHKRMSVGLSARGARVLGIPGRVTSFVVGSSGDFQKPAHVIDKLVALAGGHRYYDATSAAIETYAASGAITQIAYASGTSLDFSYSDATTPASVAAVPGLLIRVTDSFGRSLGFEYTTLANGEHRVSRIVGADGTSAYPAYDEAGRLQRITWGDSTVRRFLYENAGLPWALTGVVNESDIRYATFEYDPQGRALSTGYAGGVNRYSVSYTTPPAIRVTEVYDASAQVLYRTHTWVPPVGTVLTLPTGATSALSVSSVLGQPKLTSRSQQEGAGCGASVRQTAYDANGNSASEDDFNGNRTCRVFDLGRNLPTTSVEGLSSTVACSGVTPANAILPAGSRKTSQQWHPDWSLETKRAEPGRLITSVYNGQPDPLASNAIANCAPSTALLPDGKPIAVLCKQVEQATTDTDGSKGFSAVLQAGVVNRVWTYTYNARGQVLTAKSPRTDVNETTTYAYYEDTTAEHTLGDLKSVTNAKNQVTQYPLYTKSGQVLRMIDANNVVTDYTYDLRQRLKTITTAGRLVTSIDYHPTGQLKRATQADGSFVDYGYDDAQRLTSVSDHLGNRIEYTLDNAGNKTEEKVKDPAGALTRQMSQVMDALSRVQQSTGRN